MVTLNISNESASAQSRYLTFTLPKAVADTIGEYGELDTGEIAVRAWDDGAHPLYCVTKSWAAGDTQRTMSALGSNPGYTFSLHSDFGTSSCGLPTGLSTGVIPIVNLVLANGTRVRCNPTMRDSTPTARFSSPRMIRRTWAEHFGGHHVFVSGDFFHNSQIGWIGAEYHLADPQSPSWTVPAEAIEFVFGFEVKPWFQDEEAWTLSTDGKTVTLPLRFTDSTATNVDRKDWQGKMYTGRLIQLRAWIFGSGGLSSAVDWLECTASATDWTGHWGWSGTLPVEPQNPSSVERPAYSQTSRHYVTIDRASGGNDTTGSAGLTLHRLTHAQGTQGGFGYSPIATPIYRRQPLKDILFACGDWALRSRWTLRDGSYPQPVGEVATQLVIYSGYPHVPSERPGSGGSFSAYYGAKTDYTGPGGMIPPHRGFDDDPPDYRDGWDLQHYSLLSPVTAYMLTKDELAFRILHDEIRTMLIHSRRGIFFGSGTGGHREFGRTLNALFQAKTVCPELEGMVQEFAYAPTIGFGYVAISNCVAVSRKVNNVVVGQPNGPNYVFGGEGGALAASASGLDFAADPLWNAFGVVSLYQIAEELGEGPTGYFRTWFEKFAQAILLYQTVNDGSGWSIPYNSATYSDGRVIPEAWRISGHPVYTEIIRSPGWLGGLALRRWGSHLCKLYATVGVNAAARARAEQCLVTYRGAGQTIPFGWLHSLLEASCV